VAVHRPRHPEGVAPDAELTLKVPYQEWVDIVGGRRSGAVALLRGRLRLSGNPLALRKLRRVMGEG